MKKIFTLFLALVASVGTMFASTKKIGDLYYNLDATNQTAEVTVGHELTILGYYENYFSLETATIPASVTYSEVEYSVTSIGDSAFHNCSYLSSVTIPNSVTSIGDYAFVGCKRLTSVTIPNSVTSIGDDAFYNCTGLTSVTIPNSVTSIGDGAFANCTGLTSPVYNAHCFACMPTSYSGAYTIPNGIESIAGGAFGGCDGLTSVTIPNSVTSIGDHAFYDCSSLTSVTIPNSVTSIGERAFDGCSSLTSVTIPNSVTSIGRYAFRQCHRLTSVTIGNSVTSIGEGAFSGCSSLTSVTIPNSVTSIGEKAFLNCSSLTSVTIGNSVTSIGERAFKGCSSLTSVTIGNSVTSIGEGAFYDCSSLTSVTIPNSVTSIGKYAFNYCSGLTSVTIEAETPPVLPPVLDGDVFYQTNNCPIYVPCNAVNTYKTAEEWSSYADRIVGNCKSDCTDVNDMWLQTGGSGLGEITTDNSGVWKYEYQYGACAKADSGKTGWLLTPAKDLRGMKSVNLSFLHVHKKAGTFTDDMTLWVCANYKGSVSASQWQQLTISPYSANNDWVYVNVSIDVPFGMVGANTVFGFKYISSNSSAKWEIKELNLNAECATGEQGIEDVLSDQVQSTKVIKDGQVLILRNGKTYTMQGQEVK